MIENTHPFSAEGGVDSDFSMEPNEMKLLVDETESLGVSRTVRTDKSELKSLNLRRSIYVCKDICMGDKFNKDNIRIIRPGNGAPPHLFDTLIGKKRDIITSRNTTSFNELL